MLDLIENPMPRCACILALDTSGSMSGRPIQELKEGFLKFIRTLKEDDIASASVEIGVIAFGDSSSSVILPFTSLLDETVDWAHLADKLQASGETPMGDAVEKALAMLESRKNEYKRNGVSYYQPWFVMITDGEPTDNWTNSAQQLRNAERNRKIFPMLVGVEGANLDTLREFAENPVLLDGLKFQEFFSWLSASMSRVSSSAVEEEVILLPKNGWEKF